MGSNTSTSTSAPLSAKHRTNLYESAMSNLTKYAPQYLKNGTFSGPEYTRPAYQGAGDARTLTGGDYNKLQSDLLQGNVAGLDYAKAQDTSKLNDSLAKRGVWSSGMAQKAINDLDNSYAPAYAQAGANATQQRYNLQSGENQALNQYGLNSAQMANQFNSAQAQQEYESKWRPADYLAGIWNGTGGTISSGNAGGWSI